MLIKKKSTAAIYNVREHSMVLSFTLRQCIWKSHTSSRLIWHASTYDLQIIKITSSSAAQRISWVRSHNTRKIIKNYAKYISRCLHPFSFESLRNSTTAGDVIFDSTHVTTWRSGASTFDNWLELMGLTRTSSPPANLNSLNSSSDDIPVVNTTKPL